MLKFAANLSMLYPEHALIRRFSAAASDGFRAVEIQFPYDAPREDLAAALEKAGLVLVLHNLPAGDFSKGERGIACHPDRIAEFRRGVVQAIAYARALGCPQINCLAGIRPDNVAAEAAFATLVANLGFAAATLKEHGIRLLLEPLNRFDVPGFFVDRLALALDILDAVGSDNLFLQYDLYHQHRNGGALVADFLRHRRRIAHIQLADHPGRNEPGTGEIDFSAILKTIDEAGYAGWIGCEYRPKAGTSAGLGWMKEFAAA
jgi:hydroxypyruvate isomerase